MKRRHIVGQFRRLVAGRPWLGRILVVAMAFVVAACNNGGGGGPAY
jgi:hypothetical protein